MDFDWGILAQPTAMAMVRGQLGFSWISLRERLEGLTDDEWSWEPTPGAWSVRRRDESMAPRLVGSGDVVAEWPSEEDADDRTRTIAWLLAHLTECYVERYEHTFGRREGSRDDLVFAGDARGAVAVLEEQVDAWAGKLATLDEQDVFAVGLSRATEIDAAAPFGHVVLHLNRELIAHGAEIMLLRDLYRARS